MKTWYLENSWCGPRDVMDFSLRNSGTDGESQALCMAESRLVDLLLNDIIIIIIIIIITCF